MSIHEECGVFGVMAQQPEDVASLVYFGLYSLQHRGQESCGITVNDDVFIDVQIHKLYHFPRVLLTHQVAFVCIIAVDIFSRLISIAECERKNRNYPVFCRTKRSSGIYHIRVGD